MYHRTLSQFTNTPLQQSQPEFSFDEVLDAAWLQAHYQGDLHDAAFMFNVFFNNTLPLFSTFEEAAAKQDNSSIYRLAHQLSPGFASVGLTHIAENLRRISVAKPVGNYLLQSAENVIAAVQDLIAHVIAQKNRLDNFLSNSSEARCF